MVAYIYIYIYIYAPGGRPSRSWVCPAMRVMDPAGAVSGGSRAAGARSPPPRRWSPAASRRWSDLGSSRHRAIPVPGAPLPRLRPAAIRSTRRARRGNSRPRRWTRAVSCRLGAPLGEGPGSVGPRRVDASDEGVDVGAAPLDPVLGVGEPVGVAEDPPHEGHPRARLLEVPGRR